MLLSCGTLTLEDCRPWLLLPVLLLPLFMSCSTTAGAGSVQTVGECDAMEAGAAEAASPTVEADRDLLSQATVVPEAAAAAAAAVSAFSLMMDGAKLSTLLLLLLLLPGVPAPPPPPPP